MAILSSEGISFKSLCEGSSPFPLCNLFNENLKQTCSLSGITFGIMWLQDFVDMLICILSITLIIFSIYKAHARKAAVGRVELYLLQGAYIGGLLSQTFADAGLMGPGISNGFLTFRKWTSILHASLTTVTYWILFLNGLTVYQWVEDGSKRSICVRSSS
ncbi:hypothetical protein HMI54_011236 [Coelomomyces lativittatus]|nr:hypothetical protein HMI55_003300 [Coelomomyces lativittatus]KAJ1515988.1 hypothetical protein HMI54_011236 [Coelomomyces lativittatus]